MSFQYNSHRPFHLVEVHLNYHWACSIFTYVHNKENVIPNMIHEFSDGWKEKKESEKEGKLYLLIHVVCSVFRFVCILCCVSNLITRTGKHFIDVIFNRAHVSNFSQNYNWFSCEFKPCFRVVFFIKDGFKPSLPSSTPQNNLLFNVKWDLMWWIFNANLENSISNLMECLKRGSSFRNCSTAFRIEHEIISFLSRINNAWNGVLGS